MVAGILCSLYGKELIPLPKEIKHHTPARIGMYYLCYIIRHFSELLYSVKFFSSGLKLAVD